MAKRNRKKVYASPGIVYEKKIETLAAVCATDRSGWAPACMKPNNTCTKLNQ
jgi:hypothetical protein